jgi:hypothetical protein
MHLAFTLICIYISGEILSILAICTLNWYKSVYKSVLSNLISSLSG